MTSGTLQLLTRRVYLTQVLLARISARATIDDRTLTSLLECSSMFNSRGIHFAARHWHAMVAATQATWRRPVVLATGRTIRQAPYRMSLVSVH